MLARYKKPGGFEQLLQLIETCSPKKQESFLKLIQAESKNMSDLIVEKMLTVDKILNWDQQYVIEITTQVPIKVLAFCLYGKSAPVVQKATATFTHMQKQEITTMMTEKKPTVGELEAAYNKLIQTVRQLHSQKRIRLEKIDPKLDIPQDLKVA